MALGWGSSAMADVSAGQSFGKYRIIRLLGRGGMGAVYLAEDTVLGRDVALKVLHRALSMDGQFEARFREEARTIARLDHPNIVHIHTLERIGGDGPGGAALVIDMAYVDGGSLEDAERTGALTVGGLARCIGDVLEALSACHASGIVHRDVKPSNVLLSTSGRALLSDFGLSKALSEYNTASVASRASSTLFVGTPLYAPPEAWEGAEPSPAWDVYSVGMMLHEALAGAPPFDAGTPLALMKQVAERPIPDLRALAPNTSGELSGLVAAMLARDPAERPADAAAVLELAGGAPEFAGLPRPNTTTVVMRAPAREDAGEQEKGAARGPRRRGWAAGLLAALACAVSAVFLLPERGERATLEPRQISGTAPSLAAPRPKPAPAYRVLDTLDALTQEVMPHHWLMKPAERKGEWDVLASAGAHIWLARAIPQDESQLVLHGSWAQYADTTARYFSHGVLKGRGRWLEPDSPMSVAIEFQDTGDGARWTRSYTLRPPATPVTDAEFVRRVEAGDCIQPILYHELIPREIPWAQTVEQRFFAPGAGTVKVGRLGTSESAEFTLDGRLQESFWSAATDTAAVLPGRPRESGANLQALRVSGSDSGPDRFVIGIRLGRDVSRPGTTLGIMNRFTVPLRAAARWCAVFEGDALVDAWKVQDDERLPWDCRGEARSVRTERGREIEISLPLSDLGQDACRGKERWRMNCVIEDTADPGAGAVARWGGEAAGEAEHGAVLVF